MTRKALFAVLLSAPWPLLAPWPLPAQPAPQQLEAKLAEAEGAQRLDLLAELVRAYREHDQEKTLAYGAEALELLESFPDEARELELSSILAETHYRKEEPGPAAHYGARAVRLARARRDTSALARALRNLASAHLYQDEYEIALPLYAEARALYEELGDLEGVGTVFQKVGLIHMGRGDPHLALDQFLRAHRAFEQVGDRGAMASALTRIADVHSDDGQFDQAFTYYREALAVQLELGNENMVGSILNSLGVNHHEQGEREEALDYYRRSLAIKEKLGRKQDAARQHINLGWVLRELGDLDLAEKHLQQALRLRTELGETGGVASSLGELGLIDRERGNYTRALERLNRCIAMAEEVGETEKVHDYLEILAETYEEMGRYREAFTTLQRYNEISEELFSQESSRALAQMQARFDIDHKRKEIELLEQRQKLSEIELQRQREARWALLAGFGLLLAILLLLFNRYRLRSREAMMLATVRQERAVSARLREIDQMKDDFLANTSHELRTPLYGITGLAESVIDGAAGEVSEAVSANLAMIAASGRRLGHLVNDILDFSKLRHKNLELDRRPVDLRPLVEVVLTLSKTLAGAETLRLENEVPPDLPAAEADENRLQQILYNLVGNAVKFTEQGTVVVSASTEGQLLIVRVSDTGIGIAQERQEPIFDAFEQADGSIEREYGGTGLGLAVTRQLVELHGGSIGVESSPGEGSTFSFSLPLAGAPAEEAVSRPIAVPAAGPPEDPSPVLEPAHVSPARQDTIRILAVDDEPVNRQVLKNFLSLEHFDLVTAASGDEALDLIQRQSFDMVLLDVMMPRVSGYEVCRALRQLHPIEELPVLFLTAKNQTADVVRGLSLGANDFLTKPIARDELLARIRPHLDLLEIHHNLGDLVEQKMSRIKVLEGILPICSSCKKIRDNKQRWHQVEAYIDHHSEAEFSHGFCPDCEKDFLETLDAPL